MRRVSRGIDRLEATFDEASLVANGGLILVATLVGRLGLEALVDRMVRLGGRPGGAMPGRKVLTLVHSMISGGSCIDDADRLRSGATGAVLGHRVMAPSTLGTFLRAFTFGHVRQLEKVIAETIRRAWAAGAGPGTSTCTLDIDSTIGEVYGHAKQGAAYGYTRVLGYHPLLATRADTGEVLHARLRKGSANTARGANRFVEELVARVRRAGADGPLIVRADSGFYNDRLLATFKRLKVGYSVTIPLRAPVGKAIEAINERAWQRIEYSDGVAQLAECVYRGRRLIVRRVRNHRGTQGELFTTWRYHGFVTNRPAPRSCSTPTTATTPASSSPSATSKPVPVSNTSPPVTCGPTPPGWHARSSPTTSSAGPRHSPNPPTPASSWPRHSAPGCSTSPPASWPPPDGHDYASPPAGPGPHNGSTPSPPSAPSPPPSPDRVDAGRAHRRPSPRADNRQHRNQQVNRSRPSPPHSAQKPPLGGHTPDRTFPEPLTATPPDKRWIQAECGGTGPSAGLRTRGA